jgi:hypothetical protein
VDLKQLEYDDLKSQEKDLRIKENNVIFGLNFVL